MAHLGGKFYAGFCRLTRKNKSVKSDVGYKGLLNQLHMCHGMLSFTPRSTAHFMLVHFHQEFLPQLQNLLLSLHLPKSKIKIKQVA